ncbi:MAG: recombinase RecT [Lachnospiraceae bacterium]|nr:recombinase RecT [Lachnospiraceae bacterium]
MAVQNSLVNRKSKMGITAFLNQDNVKAQLSQAVGKNSMRFVSSVVSAVTVNPALQECTNPSILSAALLGESLNLSPSPQLGQYYMVPYENKKEGVKVAQFQMGYKGYIQLAVRSGQYRKLNVLAIKEGELIRFNPLEEEIEVRLVEDEEQREQAKTIGYYAMFEYTNGFKKAMYWSKNKMLAHADRYSQAFSKDAKEITVNGKKKTKVSFADFEAGNFPKDDEWLYSSFWYKDFDGMAYKTMLRQLISKWGVMSIDMVNAMDADMKVIKEDGTREYVDNRPEEEIIAEQPQETRQSSQESAPEQYEQQSFAQGGAEDALFGD